MTTTNAALRDKNRPTTQSVLDGLSRMLDIGAPPIRSTASIIGSDPLVPSPHRLADVTSAAMAAFGLQMAGAAEDAGADPQTVTVQATDAIDQLRATYISTVAGVSPVHTTEDPRALGNNDFYQCRNGRWIFLITTYAGLRDAVCEVLDCPPFPDRIAEAAKQWDAYALEAAVCAAGGVCAVVRSTDEWRASDPGRHLAGNEVIDIARIGESPREPFAAEHSGAALDVLPVSRPDNPDPNAMISMTGGGKRNAYADLRDPAQDRALRALCAETDVFVDSYLGMDRRGYDANSLAAARPSLPPTYLLNNDLAAYLGAAGIVAALSKRATDGGSWRVRIDLARVCMWVQDQGLFDTADVAHLPRPDAPTIDRISVDSPFGEIVEPVLPLTFSGAPTPRWGSPTPLGSSPLTWW